MFMAAGIWKFYTQMFSYKQVTIKSNISENATNNRLYQIASNDTSFIFTSSALAGLIRPAVSENFYELQSTIAIFYSLQHNYISHKIRNVKKNFRKFFCSTLPVYLIMAVFEL
jgi:hypothetical protein